MGLKALCLSCVKKIKKPFDTAVSWMGKKLADSKIKLPEFVGRASAAGFSTTYGLSVGGFIVQLAADCGLNASGGWFASLIVDGVAALAGSNAAYRIWQATKTGAVKGLQKLFCSSSSDDPKPSLKKRFFDALAIFLSGATALTYGGLTRQGISSLIKIEELGLDILASTLIIGASFICTGSVFANAWLEKLQASNTATQQSQTGTGHKILKIIIEGLTLLGLASTMMVGGEGLAVSFSKDPSVARPLTYAIAGIGFFGEAAFSKEQAETFLKELSQTREKCSTKGATLSLARALSILLYASGSWAATFTTKLAGDVLPLNLLLAFLSWELSVVTCSNVTEKTLAASENAPDEKAYLFHPWAQEANDTETPSAAAAAALEDIASFGPIAFPAC